MVNARNSGEARAAGKTAKRAGYNKRKEDLLEDLEKAGKENKRLQTENKRLAQSYDRFIVKGYSPLLAMQDMERMDATDIRNRIVDTMRGYEEWAQEYSTPGPVDCKASNFTDLPLPQSAKEMVLAIFSSKIDILKKIPHGNFILLQTMLAHFAWWFIIQDPLFFLDRGTPTKDSMGGEQFLPELLNTMTLRGLNGLHLMDVVSQSIRRLPF
ncbi:hypothetical protein FQN50_007756 [Emmonsiellopsis sp. PD_5]|nr:hypothetical protein FQN50_007756 [Emmonsiellopsis sp. PD_5]